MLVDIVKPYCVRWRDIFFVLPLSAHRQLNMSSLPCLERLTLSSRYLASDAMRDPVIIGDAPHLRRATITFIPSLQANLLMEQLTILHLEGADILQIIAVLRWCPNVVDLTCHYTSRGDHNGAPPPPVELHSLQRLHIPDAENFLVYLTAPRLERLQIGRMSDIQATTSALHAFVSRSSCALKFLAIVLGGVSDPGAQIQHLFRAANTIEHLQLSLEDSYEAPHMLLQTLRSVDILPRLRRLEAYDWTIVDGARARLLLDMLTWRKTHGMLESFELVVITSSLRCDVPPATIIAEFRVLGEAGLHVRVTVRKRGNSTSPDVLLDTLPPVNSS
jgi:hypothetical protein